MKRNLLVLTAVLLTTVPFAWAQQPGGQGPMSGPQGHPQQPDPMAENFFPPEMLMQNQKALGLTDDQKKSITEEIKKAQSRFTDLQWQMQAEQETMAALVKEDHPDEKKVLAQLDKVLSIESEVKKTHLGLLVRIKNQLTTEQQAKLREMKNQHRPRFGPRGDRDDGARGDRGDGPPGGPRQGGDRPDDAPPKE